MLGPSENAGYKQQIHKLKHEKKSRYSEDNDTSGGKLKIYLG
jgi:hypothetical protein